MHPSTSHLPAALPTLSPALPDGGCTLPHTKPVSGGKQQLLASPAQQALLALLAKSRSLREAHNCRAGFMARLGFPH